MTAETAITRRAPADPDPPATVDLWFDPSCPFTWRTARWLAGAAATRSVPVRWRLMSLAVLHEGDDTDDRGRARVERTRGPLRVLAAAQAEAGPSRRRPLYFALGRRLHDEGRAPDRAVLVEALAEVGLPTGLADAADDPAWDEAVAAEHAQGQAAVGEPSGSPVLAVAGTQGFFGPVLSGVPGDDEGAALLDALVALARTGEFTELRRARPRADRG